MLYLLSPFRSCTTYSQTLPRTVDDKACTLSLKWKGVPLISSIKHEILFLCFFVFLFTKQVVFPFHFVLFSFVCRLNGSVYLFWVLLLIDLVKFSILVLFLVLKPKCLKFFYFCEMKIIIQSFVIWPIYESRMKELNIVHPEKNIVDKIKLFSLMNQDFWLNQPNRRKTNHL